MRPTVSALLSAFFLLAGLAAPRAAAAEDDGSTTTTSSSAPDTVTFEAYGQQSFDDGIGLGVGARIHPTRSAFLLAEGRGLYGSHWIGRGTIGLDLLGGSKTFDVTLGLFLGTTGRWAPIEIPTASPTAGFELGLGINAGPIRARYRHADGFKGPLEYHLTENEWRLGYQLGRTQVFGQYLRFNPGEEQVSGGFGAGLAMTF